MEPQLPPPDPHEDLHGPPPGLELADPVMCFPLGTPDAAEERLASAILEYRPGALFVFATD
jgi:hypothetical protein